jgi:activator of 2-hydroxyglutaryl-CoA dehydratase
MDYFSDKVIFTGGLAKRGSVLSKMIAEETGSDVSVPEHPQITCAYGAALYAKETYLSPSKSGSETNLQRPTGPSLET